MSQENKPPMIYNELAEYYDKVYKWKEYERESAAIIKLINEFGNGGKTILDAGCGTGMHLLFLENKYDTTGIDPSKPMLDIASRRLSKAELMQSDMSSFRADRKYDNVISMFSTVNYILTKDGHKKAFRNMHDALNDGGLFMADLFFTEGFDPNGKFNHFIYEEYGVGAAMVTDSKLEGNDATFTFAYLIKDGKKSVAVIDNEKLNIYSSKEITDMLKDSGFEVAFLELGDNNAFRRSYFVAKKA